MSDIYNAIICNDNELLDQFSDLMEKNNTIEGRAAIADCLTIIIRNRRQAFENDFQKRFNDGLSEVVDEKTNTTAIR